MSSDPTSLAVGAPGASHGVRLSGDTPVVREVAHAMSDADADADAAHRRLRSVFASSVGLSPLEFNALMRIGEGDELTLKALAAYLDITTGAVTAMTDRLVGAGLVERTPNPNDRRSLLLSLTATGNRARDTMYAQYYDAIARALQAAPSSGQVTSRPSSSAPPKRSPRRPTPSKRHRAFARLAEARLRRATG